jgi:hypothetical protein
MQRRVATHNAGACAQTFGGDACIRYEHPKVRDVWLSIVWKVGFPKTRENSLAGQKIKKIALRISASAFEDSHGSVHGLGSPTGPSVRAKTPLAEKETLVLGYLSKPSHAQKAPRV